MSLKPTPAQLDWQDLQFGMFCHFGINTFYGQEWSDGTLDPAGFAPRCLDARQWVETTQLAGIRYLILTAKHHDGFCLWPTATTDYSVRSSPFTGDVVGQVAAACRELAMPFGLYLSPWDRHAACYADPVAYDRFYVAQLTELCTQYGPLVEVWFDGAGSTGRTYDWDAIMAVVDRHQPEAMVFNMGRPTIRWVGNEDGLATDPCRYVVDCSPGTLPYTDDYLASAPRYLPPECDVSIRRGWFWHPEEEQTLKSVDHLVDVFYRSVGRGANLLLNVPPNRDGLIDEADRTRLLELARELRRRFAEPMPGELRQDGGSVTVEFGQAVEVDHLVLREALDDRQLIDGYRVLVEPGEREIAQGATIGSQKLAVFPAVRTARLRIELAGPGGRLRAVTAYRTGHESLPGLAGTTEAIEGSHQAD
jgi:alpha-L-fucosidase